MSRASRDDQGSATIWVLCCCGVVLALATAILALGVALVARHRAAVVADLAALAAAQALLEGAAPCPSAARVAAQQAGQLVGCSVVGDVVEVVAQVSIAPAGRLSAVLPPARARARAGRGPPG